MEHKIKLGDKVRDKVSGLVGIAVARTEFLNGYIQYTVVRKLKPGQDLNPMGDPTIDERCLEVIKKKVIISNEYENDEDESEETSTGGPVRFSKGMRGY